MPPLVFSDDRSMAVPPLQLFVACASVVCVLRVESGPGMKVAGCKML